MTNDHTVDINKMEPLTIEQLKELHGRGKFIGACVLLSINGVKCCGVLDCREDDGLCASYAASGRWLKEKDYGKTWLAYAYPTAHIDRETWVPCDYCTNTLRNRKVYKTETYPGICDFEVFLDNGVEIAVNAYNHQTPYTEEICFSFPVSYCPKCGRPLTPNAWDELKNRFRG